MSAASLLTVYDGANPAVLVVDAVGGGVGVQSLAQVLQVGNSAGVDDINMNGKSILAALDVVATGDVSVGGDVKGTAAATFVVQSAATHAVRVEGAAGASLVATTGDCKVEASAGVLELNFDGVGGQLNVVPLAAQFTNVASAAAANGPTYAAAALKQLQIQIGGVPYWIALNPAAFA